MKALKNITVWLEDNAFILPFFTKTISGNIHLGFSIPLYQWVSKRFFKNWNEDLIESEASIVYVVSEKASFEIFHDGTFNRCYFIFIKLA
jgi:hypothetical protein